DEVDHPPDAAPVLLERIEALYPPEARAAGLSATVGLELTVDAEGHVSGVKVVRAAGFGFDDSAVAAARQMRFRPAMHDGKPVASTVLFDQRFVLRPHLTAESSAAADGAATTASAPAPLSPAADAPPPPAYESVV